MAERSGSDLARAAYLARVVLEVVEEAASGGLMERVRDALPDGIRALATAGSTGSAQT